MITGITGQDGSYLAEFLLEKGYEVHGIKRRASLFNTQRIDHIYEDPHVENSRFRLHYGDLTDSSNLTRILSESAPDEVYNLGAQSHVAVCFEAPEYTADVDAIGTLRLLEAIRFLGLEKRPASIRPRPPSSTAWCRKSRRRKPRRSTRARPMRVAKMYAYWITVNYREAYGMYACNGILFNHESPRRGETFVTRKITRGLANIAQGLEACLFLGNIDSLRDWGHAKDYVRMQWMMLQQEAAEDFVIATGKQNSVREFVTWSAAELGIELRVRGKAWTRRPSRAAVTGDKAPAREAGRRDRADRSALFPPGRSGNLARRPDQGKARSSAGCRKSPRSEMCAEMVAADLGSAAPRAAQGPRPGPAVVTAKT